MNLVMGIWVIVVLIMVWVMWFYLGWLLIDIRHDLRSVRRHMDQIINRKIR